MFGIFGKKGTEKVQLGTRVVRGPNWNHKSEDNGEGFLGTIVALCHSDRTVQVIWDTGRGGKYRADPNQYDLRLFDNAPTDQLHQNTFCFSCKESPIYGMKWTCTKCNINLCTQCYMDDYHDVEHIFERTVTSESRRFKVRSRQNSTEKIAAKGIFEGAEVVGGPYLNRNDDHNNDVGYVEQITNWKNKYQRGIVKVFWKNTEIENIHRLGAEGCVDIVCSRLTENATWGNYYPDHLPVIDFDNVCSNIPVSVFSDDQKGEQNETNIERILPSELSMHLKIDAHEGDIWKGEWIQKTVKPVCIKLFKPGSYKDVIKEASIIKLCSHDSVLKLYGVTPTFDWIVMEWFSAWNLLAYLRPTNEKQHTIHLKQIINIATQIASGMAHLEKKRILHRSLKAANILIDSFQTVKITGFGYAVILAADTPDYTADKKEEFPVRWLPKEAFKYTYNTKSDVWSYGILLFELISLGDVPYCNMSDAEVVDFVNSGEVMAKPDVGIPCPDLYYAKMSQCMNGNVSMRPKFVDLYHCFDGYFDLQMKYENMKISITELKIDTKFSGEFQIWKVKIQNLFAATVALLGAGERTLKHEFFERPGTWLKQQPKLVRIYGSSLKTYVDILGQAGVMQLCDHNNIIQLYGVTPTLDLMVREFFSEIDLETFLQQSEKRNKEEKVDLAKLVQIASQVACGMDYLGTKRILHRDLRTAHVLINDKLETKICGFHLAIVLKEDEDHYKLPRNEKCPIRWTAVEAVLDGKLTIKSDVWSFGILLVELTTLGQRPYPGMANRVVLELVERGYRQPQPSKCPDNIYKIMLSCWHTSPNNRPTFDYLFDFFDNYCESAEPEVADFNPERTHLDIYRILQTELTFDKKISDEKNVGGIIWKGEWILKTRKPVRIKLFQKGKYKDFIREASIMNLCSHNNVLKLYGITTTVDWIVMEFVFDLNLLEYMLIYKENKINFNQMLHIAAQVACGMNYLGTKRIVHIDLKAANVFINDYHETKIYGFHLARVLGKDEDEFKPANDDKFSKKWTAPEAAFDRMFTFKSDVWSFGIFLVELITLGQTPYQGLTNMDCLKKVERGFRHEKPENCPENLYKIMLSCWNKEPTKRPTFEYLFNYFDDYVVSAELEREEEEQQEEEPEKPEELEQQEEPKEQEKQEDQEEEDNKELYEIEVHSDASADNKILQSWLPANLEL